MSEYEGEHERNRVSLHAQTPQEGVEDSEAKRKRPNVSHVRHYGRSEAGNLDNYVRLLL